MLLSYNSLLVLMLNYNDIYIKLIMQWPAHLGYSLNEEVWNLNEMGFNLNGSGCCSV